MELLDFTSQSDSARANRKAHYIMEGKTWLIGKFITSQRFSLSQLESLLQHGWEGWLCRLARGDEVFVYGYVLKLRGTWLVMQTPHVRETGNDVVLFTTGSEDPRTPLTGFQHVLLWLGRTCSEWEKNGSVSSCNGVLQCTKKNIVIQWIILSRCTFV